MEVSFIDDQGLVAVKGCTGCSKMEDGFIKEEKMPGGGDTRRRLRWVKKPEKCCT